MEKLLTQLLTQQETADLLKVSRRTLFAWSHQDPPYGPQRFAVGGTIRYAADSVREFIQGEIEFAAERNNVDEPDDE